MLKFDNVSMRYDKTNSDVLKNVSFHLEKGEIAFLTGHSGAGKSSLFKLIAMMEDKAKVQIRGQITFNNHNVSRVKSRQIPLIRREMGLIFQDYKLLDDRTVFDNVALPLIINGWNYNDIVKRVRVILDKVGLRGKEKQYVFTLSGGEQQRVGIARAVVVGYPQQQLILADEPTGNLDPDLSAEIMKLFEQFQQIGMTILIVSHDISLISKLNHRVLTLEHGQLISDGSS
jgi:cell division transport system ATP-binding protein